MTILFFFYFLGGTLLVEVPMIDPEQQYESVDENRFQAQDTWQWWNKFRSVAEFHPRMMVALEMSADLPSKEEILRWLGEPVDLLIIPTHCFIRNASNYPVLGRAHKSVALKFLSKLNCKFVLKSSNDELSSLNNHVQYLKHLYDEHAKLPNIMEGYDDILEIPLQPLYDNLDSYTYEVFEKDPVKYLYYQRAIEGALVDKIPKDEISTKTVSFYLFSF